MYLFGGALHCLIVCVNIEQLRVSQSVIIIPHVQRERDKVIGVGVHYIYVDQNIFLIML